MEYWRSLLNHHIVYRFGSHRVIHLGKYHVLFRCPEIDRQGIGGRSLA